MVKLLGKLSARRVETVKTPGRHSDGGGLYLYVKPSGTKSWVFMWKVASKRREMGLGPARDVSLARARDLAAEARRQLIDGQDPLELRKRASPMQMSFGEAADAFVENMSPSWRNDKHKAQWRMTLTNYCEEIRSKPVGDICMADVLSVLQPVWLEKNETASRLRGRIERVLDFAKARGYRSGENPARWRGNLDAVLPKRQKLQRGHHKAKPFEDVPALIEKSRAVQGLSARALEFCILTAARSGEVLGAQWDEIDLTKRIWTIPANRMKAGRPHRVPLSSQAMEILEALSDVRLNQLVFPGARKDKPLSGMSMAMQLRRLGATETVHGFRSSFRDWAGEKTHFPHEVAESALAHVIGDATERAYRRADALEKRRALMQAWADYCTSK